MTLPVLSPTYPEVMTSVYRLYDAAGHLLYVGIAEDFDVRFKQHAHGKDWWLEVSRRDVTWFDNRLDALYEEARAIRDESPIHNGRRGTEPIGLMLLAHRSSQERFDPLRLMRGWSAPLVCPIKPELEIEETGCRNLIRAARGSAHVAVIREGQPVAIALPWSQYSRACAGLQLPADPERMHKVAASELFRRSSYPGTLSIKLERAVSLCPTVFTAYNKPEAIIVPVDWYEKMHTCDDPAASRAAVQEPAEIPSPRRIDAFMSAGEVQKTLSTRMKLTQAATPTNTVIMLRGRPTAVLVSVDEYRKGRAALGDPTDL